MLNNLSAFESSSSAGRKAAGKQVGVKWWPIEKKRIKAIAATPMSYRTKVQRNRCKQMSSDAVHFLKMGQPGSLFNLCLSFQTHITNLLKIGM